MPFQTPWFHQSNVRPDPKTFINAVFEPFPEIFQSFDLIAKQVAGELDLNFEFVGRLFGENDQPESGRDMLMFEQDRTDLRQGLIDSIDYKAVIGSHGHLVHLDPLLQ
ncbi:MAG: hypothetical protein ABIH23_02470 [bacterium]